MRTRSIRLLVAALCSTHLLLLAGGCSSPAATEDSGADIRMDAGDPRDGGEGEAEAEADDAGAVAGEGEGEGEAERDDAGDADAGPQRDGGSPFDFEDLFGEAGVPEELACLPGTLPQASVSGLLASLELSVYAGFPETGVRCGGVTCAPDVPCCVLCGSASCAVSVDGGPVECPAFTQPVRCDGAEDCPAGTGADTCCYSLGGTDCRAETDCDFSLASLLDGGISFPSFDAGGSPLPDDAGTSDAGTSDAGTSDAGTSDAGAPTDAGTLLDAGPAGDAGDLTDAGGLDAGREEPAMTDAGTAPGDPVGDALAQLLEQGVPVCRGTISDCDFLGGELCCTSERIVGLDLGLCVSALLCVGGAFPMP